MSTTLSRRKALATIAGAAVAAITAPIARSEADTAESLIPKGWNHPRFKDLAKVQAEERAVYRSLQKKRHPYQFPDESQIIDVERLDPQIGGPRHRGALTRQDELDLFQRLANKSLLRRYKLYLKYLEGVYS